MRINLILLSILFVGCTQVSELPIVPVVPPATTPGILMENNMTFFITSEGPGDGGNLGGLAGADAHCERLADVVGVGDKEWRAYLSATGVDARDRIGSGPWHNAKGVLIADDIEDLHDNATKLIKETQLNERGEVVNGRGDTPNRHDIMTGSDNKGMFVGTNSTCDDWASNTNGSRVLVGHHDRIGGGYEPASWNNAHVSRGCSQENLKASGGDGLFYCFAID